MKKNILMITTGGTISCEETSDGLAPSLSAERILSYVPNIEKICNVKTLEVCKTDATNITPAHWKKIVRAIEENYNNFDGFVICHGTDTLSYTASALSYMIQNSNKPIVITGSQKPINAKITDAKRNLTDSFIYASDESSEGVNVVFNGKVIVGTRAKKENTKSFDAFLSVNYPDKAIIRDGIILRQVVEESFSDDVKFYYEMNENVSSLKLFPGVDARILSYLFINYDCIVIEGFGAGGIPDYLKETFYEGMNKALKSGKCVVMTTQITNEGSNMLLYEVGRKIKQDFELIESFDMTFEATITKLMWIMGTGERNYTKIRELFYTKINNDIFSSENVSK